MIYSKHQILALAPDAETKKNVFNFARARQWAELEGNEHILWGTCKTYRRNFKTWVSLSKLKYKCSCKAKMPCRHALGLLLVYIEQSDVFRVTYDLPEKIAAWQNGTEIVKKEAPTDPKKEELSRISRLKAWEKRMESMSAGLDELDTWLHDILRQGLADLQTASPDFWEGISSRMVDTKLGSIARRIRLMPEIIEEQEDWHHLILKQLGEIYLIVKGFRNMENLPDPLQKEMLNLAGVNQKKEGILQQKGILDNWIILGQVRQKIENLESRRTWILGENTKKWAVFLDFTWGQQPFEHNWKTGQIIRSELVYYPSSFPMRALTKATEYLPRDVDQLPAYPNLKACMIAYSKALAANPWLREFPLCIKNVTPLFYKNRIYIQDDQQHIIPIKASETIQWKIMALSGGQHIRIFGEWANEQLKPLSIFVEERLVIL